VEMRRFSLLALVATLLVSLLSVPLSASAVIQELPANAVEGTVVAVEDGATLRVVTAEGEELVRLAGLDPMGTGLNGAPAECFGVEAIQKVQELLPTDGLVWLEGSSVDRDDQGRLVRYVWVPNLVEGGVTFLNESFLRRGLAAHDSSFATDQYGDRLEEAAERGQSRQRGFWRACGEPHAPAGIAPTGLAIPSIGITAPIEVIGINGGVMDVPEDPWNVGWYRELGALERNVNIVMSGHVDWWGVGPTIFYNLSSVSQGDAIYVSGDDGVDREYRVTSIWTVGADSTGDDVDAVIGATGGDTLTLITCTGDFTGERYVSRLIVRAERV
jgi:LPXTG-site transpeptidase (sortase) family protein